VADDEKPWYKDPPKLIPVLVGLTVIGGFVAAEIGKIGPGPPSGRVEYVVDTSAAMKGKIGEKAKLPAVATEIVDHADGRPKIATALRLTGGQGCSAAYRPPDVGFSTKNGDALRQALDGATAAGRSNFANAVTAAASDVRSGDSGVTTILIFVGGEDTCSRARSASIIRQALQDLRHTPDVNVNFKFVGVKVPPRVRKVLEAAKKEARHLDFVADTDYANKPSELPDVVQTPTPTPTGTPAPSDTSEPSP
jgi:hypothetical protein